MADDEKTRVIRRDTDDVTRKLWPETPTREVNVRDETEQPRTRLALRPSDNRLAVPGRPVVDTEPDDDDDRRLIVGWLVVIAGPGRGKYAPIFDGMNSVGRAPDQTTRLDFGDEGISRSNHAYITYDYVDRKFYVQHGGKSSLVRVNKAPVLQPTELKQDDEISLGETMLRFVPFCGEGFDWQEK